MKHTGRVGPDETAFLRVESTAGFSVRCPSHPNPSKHLILELQIKSTFGRIPRILRKIDQLTGSPRAIGGPGTKLRNDAPCDRGEQNIFFLGWLKIHFRAFPAVKM